MTTPGKILVIAIAILALFALIFMVASARATGKVFTEYPTGKVLNATDAACVHSDELKAIIKDRQYKLSYIKTMTGPELKLLASRLNASEPFVAIDLYQDELNQNFVYAMVFNKSGCYHHYFSIDRAQLP
jgi:hypothetical protein